MERVQLTPELVQAVRDAISIEELASDYTQLRKNGQRLIGLCPFHREKTPSFSIDPQQGLYYCFGCGAGGDAIGLHMQLTGDDFPAAIEALAMRFAVPLPSPVRSRPSGGRKSTDTRRALEAAQEFFRRSLEQSAAATAYLERRKVSAELVDGFGVGYAPQEWRALCDALSGRIPLAELEAAGLLSRSERNPDRPFDRFRHRLIFPIRSATGTLLGFGGRTLGDDKAKYVNSRESESFQKGHLLYGLDRARRPARETGRLLLVEGYFDVLAAVASGVDWVVASMGTALTRQQARLLSRYADEVIVGYDGDRAGEEASRKALPLLLAEGLSVRRAAFPAGQDPDSLRLEEGPEAVREIVEGAEDAVLREIERLPSAIARQPQRQAEAAAELRELLTALPDAALRYAYGRRAAERLDLPPEVLWQAGGAARGTPAPRSAGVEPGADEPRPKSSVAPVVAKGGRPPASTEERCLQLLFAADAVDLAAGRLPPEEVFLQPVCRQIYAALREELEAEGPSEQGSERSRRVRSRLPSVGPAIDRLAEILLQESVQPGAGELAQKLLVLERRFYEQRNRELAREIQAAQREGDVERLHRLVEEKQDLSRRLHPRRTLESR